MFPTKVLRATDGSSESVRAARLAVELSNKLGSELHVVHVGFIPSFHPASEPVFLDAELRDMTRERAETNARHRLEEQVEKIKMAGGKVAEAYAKFGRPDAEIVRLAEELGVGLVILGSRGLGRLKRAVTGSVSSSVVRHAHCSVLVVRVEGIEKARLPGTILLALDGSREAAAAVRAATEIANGTGSDLHLLYVLQTEPYVPHLGPEVWEDWQAALARVKREAWSWIHSQGERIEAERGKVKDTHLAFGKPDEEIVKVAEALDAGLVVTGSRGLGGVRRALMGSVSDSVVRHAHCPVLVVRREQSHTGGSGRGRRGRAG